MKGIEGVYQLTLRNGVAGDFFRGHFSAQKFGSLEMDFVFCVCLLVLVGLAADVTGKIHRLHLLHPAVLFWATSIGLRATAQVLRLVSTTWFAISGQNSTVFDVTAQLLYGVSMSALFACLLLLSNGYAIIHHAIERIPGTIWLVALVSYTVAIIACTIAMEFLQHRGDTLSRYHSPASYVYVSVHLLAWVCFLASTGHTVVKRSENRLFFIRLFGIFSIWFWNVPFWICITSGLSSKQYTETMVRIWDEVITLVMYVLLMLLLRPENINKVFPLQKQQQQQQQPESKSHEAMVPPKSPMPTIKITSPPSTPKSTTREDTPKHKVKGVEEPKSSKPSSPMRAPMKLPAIGGKPGDLPPPGYSLAKSIANLGAEVQFQQRPKTTSGLPSTKPRQPLNDNLSTT
ncbi:unnamed protein product [Dicrocoelium dendriticum]|nr:unnamed protein product [Dicrocoelium dendriticum]